MRNYLLLLALLNSRLAWAHSGEGLLLYPLFFALAIVASLLMAAFWLVGGLVVGLLFSSLLARFSGKTNLLFYLLPAVNVLVWFLAYPLVAMLPAAYLGDSMDITHPLRPPALYLTLIAVPILILVGLATAAGLKAIAYSLNRWRH